MQAKQGALVEYLDLYISKLIIFFLSCCYGFKIPIFLVIGIIHILIIEQVAKYIQVHLAKTPANHKEISDLVDHFIVGIVPVTILFLI